MALHKLTAPVAESIAAYSKTMSGYITKIAEGLVAGDSGYATAANYIVKLRLACKVEDDDGNEVPDVGGRSTAYRAGWAAAMEMAFGDKLTKADKSRISDATRYHVNKILVDMELREEGDGRAVATPVEKVNRAIDRALPTTKVDVVNDSGKTVKVEKVNEDAAIPVVESIRSASRIITTANARLSDGATFDTKELASSVGILVSAARELQTFTKAAAEAAIAAEAAATPEADKKAEGGKK